MVKDLTIDFPGAHQFFYRTMKLKPEKQTVSIVLLGQFTPALFQPTWFAARGLIREQEAEAAEIKVIHPQVTQFRSEWLQIYVNVSSFQALTTRESYNEPLRDLVLGIFSLIEHTPVSAMGINCDFEYIFRDQKSWHEIGHRLAPKKVWEGVMDSPGLLHLIMQGNRPDKYSGYLRASINSAGDAGLTIQVNDHYQIEAINKIEPQTQIVLRILREQWRESLNRGLRIAEKIIDIGD